MVRIEMPFVGVDNMNKYEISNFISLKEAAIKPADFTILIGPQASGKSVVAKIVYLFRSFPRLLHHTLLQNKGKRELDGEYLRLFRTIFPDYSWENKAFRLCHTTEHGDICFEGNPKSRGRPVTIKYSDHYAKLITNAQYMNKRLHENLEKEMKTRQKQRRLVDQEYEYGFRLANVIREKIDFGYNQSVDSPVFIPSGRSFFSSLEKNVFAFLANNINIDHFLKEFGNTYNTAKSVISFLKYEDNMDIEKELRLMEEVVGGTYFQERRLGKEWIISEGGRKTEVVHTSSGQQEALPLLVVLTTLPFLSKDKGNLYIVEEPEAHLFPRTQKNVLEKIVRIYHQTNRSSTYLITTHSPYILSVANVLIKGGVLQKKYSSNSLANANEEEKSDRLNKLYKIVPREHQIPPGKIEALLVESGTIKSIVDNSTGLINDEAIDYVSESIADDFDKLINLDYLVHDDA